MSEYRYQLEKYRGRGSRYVCPKCRRKHTFTRYIDTYNNIYINDDVGKCNRIDKCGYHYTPHQYFEDNPHLRDMSCSHVHRYRVCEQVNKEPPNPHFDTIPEWIVEGSLRRSNTHVEWLRGVFNPIDVERVVSDYQIGGTREGDAVFWQRDAEGRVRTGKIMAYDPTTGKRLKGGGSVDWVHSTMLRQGLVERFNLRQCLYGEHLLSRYPGHVVGVVESYKTAHIASILMPDIVWTATDSLSGLTAERLAGLRGRRVIIFPDEGRGYEEWSAKISKIAQEVGFDYRLSSFVEGGEYGEGADIADVVNSAEYCPF